VLREDAIRTLTPSDLVSTRLVESGLAPAHQQPGLLGHHRQLALLASGCVANDFAPVDADRSGLDSVGGLPDPNPGLSFFDPQPDVDDLLTDPDWPDEVPVVEAG
jgi:hypothetical protein